MVAKRESFTEKVTVQRFPLSHRSRSATGKQTWAMWPLILPQCPPLRKYGVWPGWFLGFWNVKLSERVHINVGILEGNGMGSLLRITLGKHFNECCENPNKYQLKRKVYFISLWGGIFKWVGRSCQGPWFLLKSTGAASVGGSGNEPCPSGGSSMALPSARKSEKLPISHALEAVHSPKFFNFHLRNGNNEHIPAHLRIVRCVVWKA